MSGCTFCDTRVGSLTVSHTRLECPRRRSTYCVVCCTYGHSVECCPDKIALAIRAGKSIQGVHNLTLKIQDSEQSICLFLKQHGIQTTNQPGKNLKLLRNFANSMEPPHLLFFVPVK